MLSKIFSGIFSILGVASWLLNDITDELKIIITLSFFVGGLLIYTVSQSIRIKKDGNSGHASNEPSFTEKECDYTAILRQAKKEIFISGTGFAFLDNFGVHDVLLQVSEKIPVNIIASDLSKPAIIAAWKVFTSFPMIEISNKTESSKKIWVDRLKEKEKANYSPVDLFFPIAYFAVDYRKNTKSSFIQVKHYLLNPSSKQLEAYYCTIRPRHMLYDLHQKQIFLLEEYSNKNKSEVSP